MADRASSRFTVFVALAMAIGLSAGAATNRPPTPPPRPGTGWSSGTWSSGGSRTRACWTPSARSPATSSSRPTASRHGLRRRVDPDRRGADDHTALRRRLHDRGARPQADRQGLRGRHRLGLPVGDPLPAGQGRLLGRDPRAARQARPPRSTRSSATPTSTPGSATATPAGPKPPPSTRSSSPAPERIPPPLVDQLKEGGRMVIPLGSRFDQIVHLMIKKDGKLVDKELRPTLFVPMTGKAQQEGRSRRTRSRSDDRIREARARQGIEAGLLVLSCSAACASAAPGRSPGTGRGIERPAPPPAETSRPTQNGDGVPDGWYNLRDATSCRGGRRRPPLHLLPVREHRARLAGRGRAGPSASTAGRPRRSSSASGSGMTDDRARRADRRGPGPARSTSWARTCGTQTRGDDGPLDARRSATAGLRVAKRIPVPPDTLDAIMSVGLMGATGVLDFDGLTIDLVPRGGTPTTNLVAQRRLRAGRPRPGPLDRRTASAGVPSPATSRTRRWSCDRQRGAGCTGLALPVDGFGSLEISAYHRATGLRGSGGARRASSSSTSRRAACRAPARATCVFRWAGTYGWRAVEDVVRVPTGRVQGRAPVREVRRPGRIRSRRREVVRRPRSRAGRVDARTMSTDETDDWLPVAAAVEDRRGLGARLLVPPRRPGRQQASSSSRRGELIFEKGGRAPVLRGQPAAARRRSRTRDRRRPGRPAGPIRRQSRPARRPGHPARARPEPLRRHPRRHQGARPGGPGPARPSDRRPQVARDLRRRSNSSRRRKFRDGDDSIANARQLPPGGGPAAAFDPSVREAASKAAEALLGHVNPETGLALRDDPALAWVTLAGEVSLFDLVEPPIDWLPPRLPRSGT